MFGYFPAPFVFGRVADHDKSDPIGSMRLAMGTITYWSMFSAIFLITAQLIQLRRQNNNRLQDEKTELGLVDLDFNRDADAKKTTPTSHVGAAGTGNGTSSSS